MRFDSQLSRMNCRMFFMGFNSGTLGGNGSSVILAGTSSLVVVCHPARSRMRTPWAFGATCDDISFKRAICNPDLYRFAMSMTHRKTASATECPSSCEDTPARRLNRDRCPKILLPPSEQPDGGEGFSRLWALCRLYARLRPRHDRDIRVALSMYYSLPPGHCPRGIARAVSGTDD